MFSDLKDKRLEITQYHIDNGKPDSVESCPLALAFTDFFDGEITIEVASANVVLYSDETNETCFICNSNGLNEWIIGFDEGDNVLPETIRIYEQEIGAYSYYLDIVSEV